MFDIIEFANELFKGTVSFCKEIFPEFNCEYQIVKPNLPSRDDLIKFMGCKPERDKMDIIITSDLGTIYVGNDDVWDKKYEELVQDLYDEDEIVVSIKVTKRVELGKISVYSLNNFVDFLCGLKPEQIFENFTTLFEKCGEHISFQLLDQNGSLRTNSIAFSDNDVHWMSHYSRKSLLRACQDAGVFLEKVRIRLIPQDFEITGLEGTGFERVKDLFSKLQTMLSYIYLANTATITNGKAILQFDPSNKGYEYDLNQLTTNAIVPQIYAWAFREDSFIDKASIARKIINTYCRNRESILLIDEKVFNSIKSDYIIYQKNHVDQYIDMKNKLSDYIVNCVEKIQDLSHDIVDAFRNNFVAVIVFLLTVLLTDSIDPSQFFKKEASPKLVLVCGLFTVATLLYFIVTCIMGNQKWAWLKQSYNDLKKNYEDIFDAMDIEEAFNHDAPLKHAEEQYKSICLKIKIVWIVLIVALAIFTVFLAWQENYDVIERLLNSLVTVSTERQ